MRFWFVLYLFGIFIGLGCVLPGISTAQLGTNNNGLSDVWEDIFSPASVHRVSEIFDVNSVSLSLAFVSPEFASQQ